MISRFILKRGYGIEGGRTYIVPKNAGLLGALISRFILKQGYSSSVGSTVQDNLSQQSTSLSPALGHVNESVS
jgi:hypothetical protein